MKTPEQIINEIRNFISETKPFKFARSGEVILNSLTELENVLFPSESIVEEPIIEEVVEETVIDTEQNVLIKNEEGIFEEITLVEETIVEEPVTTKRGAKKK